MDEQEKPVEDYPLTGAAEVVYECDNDNKIQQIREVVARTIYTTPAEALNGVAKILHIIDGTPT
jgi:hypothetical protein